MPDRDITLSYNTRLAAVMLAVSWAALPAGTVLADEPSSAAAPSAQAADQPAPAPRPRTRVFDLWEIDVQGNTLLPQGDIQDAVMPYLGESRPTSDVDAARAAVEALYRERGYKSVRVSIPPQKVKDGTVILQVTEPRIRHLNVVGSKYHSIEAIKAEVPGLSEGITPNTVQVQKQLISVNRDPDRIVTPTLHAQDAEHVDPDAIDMDLLVDDKLPLHGNFEVNNRYNQNTSDVRASANLSYGNLWQRGDTFALTMQEAIKRPKESRLVFGTYLTRLQPDSPVSFLFSGLKTNSNISTLGTTTVLGKGNNLGVQALWQLPAEIGDSRSVSMGITFKNSPSIILLGTGETYTALRYAPISLGFSRFHHGESTDVQSDVSLTFDLPGYGSSRAQLAESRFGDDANGGPGKQQLALHASSAITHDLHHGFQAYLHVAGQLAPQVLIANEQFTAGGADTVRGYLEAETLGDSGITTTVELRSPSLPDLFPSSPVAAKFQESRIFEFYDDARLYNRGPFFDQQSARKLHISSVGIGLNFGIFSHVNGSFAWALPLIGSSGSVVTVANKNTPTKADQARVLFRLWTSF